MTRTEHRSEDANADVVDVVVVGGGPAGLSAALALGRGRKRVLLVDEAGTRRNAAAVRVHNFVTRDGTPPEEFRRVAREQLGAYATVAITDARILSITGARGAFAVRLAGDAVVVARRVLLCTGMIDEMLPLAGFRELWGRSIFQCPYCHGFELRDRRWGYLAKDAASLPFAIKLRGWTKDVVAFTNGAFDVAAPTRDALAAAGVRLELRPITALTALTGAPDALAAVEVAGGGAIPCEVLFTHPPQHQVDVVQGLARSHDLALDVDGFIRADAATRETSVPGIYAAGDSTSRLQGAIFAAAAGAQAAASINAELTAELATAQLL